MDEASALVTVRALSHQYGRVPALDNVSLALAPGEIVALVGRNGAGKSTLLRSIAGWAVPSRGEIEIAGITVRRHERAIRRHALLVPDTPPFWDDLTAWEHLRFVAGAQRLGTDWPERARALLERFGLEGQEGAFPAGLSRGMRHKLALCMAALVQPRLLLLDEPFGPLDALSATRLWELLTAFVRDGRGVLVSCHQWPAAALPDRVIVMEAGAVRADGPTVELGRRFGLAPVTPEGLLRAVLGDQEDATEPGAGA